MVGIWVFNVKSLNFAVSVKIFMIKCQGRVVWREESGLLAWSVWNQRSVFLTGCPAPAEGILGTPGWPGGLALSKRCP